MHEDNHAEIVCIFFGFCHKETTNAISISYDFIRQQGTRFASVASRPGLEKWKKYILIIPKIPLPQTPTPGLPLQITDTLQAIRNHVPYPLDSLKFNTDSECRLLPAEEGCKIAFPGDDEIQHFPARFFPPQSAAPRTICSRVALALRDFQRGLQSGSQEISCQRKRQF
jgi:hypothetical protein